MKRIPGKTRAIAIALAGVFAAFAASAQEETLPGAPEFASALVQYHAYLFAADQRAALDSIHRDLREAQDAARRATTDDAKSAAASKRTDAARRLITVLEHCPNRMDIDLGHAQSQKTLDKPAPVVLPAESGAFLFRVTSGDGAPRAVSIDYDLSERSNTRLPVQVAPDCVTWVLLTLNNVPQLTTEIEIEFSPGGPPTTILPMTLASPDRGTLKVSILSDDTGRPTPAMVRLVRKFDERAIGPANAIDFGPQFDHQGNFSPQRRANLPAQFAGSYWCCPGPFSMQLAPGEWDIAIHRGAEHAPVFDSFTIASNRTVEKTYRPRRWIDMRKKGWYSGDDHVHGQILSDGDAHNLLTWIEAEDVHLANVVKMGDIHRTWFEQRGFGRDYRVRRGDYILSPGQECPRTHNELGHTIHMNINHMIRNTEQYYLYDTVFDEVQAHGGLSGYCHVNVNMFHVHRDMTLNVPKGVVDFAEILQFANLGTDVYYDFLNLGFKVTASAGSDVPWGGSVGEVRLYAYTGRNRFNADTWFQAVDRGNTFVTNGVMLELSVNAALPGDEIVTDRDRPLRVRAKAYGDPARAVPTKLELVVHGEAVKSAEPSSSDQKELSLNISLPAANGFWIAARAEGSDGSRAHTTPVYVIRQGLRFWKYDAVNELIARRLASLAEIEQIVADATARNHSGEVDSNRPIRQLALQGPQLLERVSAAKSFYEALMQTAEAERGLRDR